MAHGVGEIDVLIPTRNRPVELATTLAGLAGQERTLLDAGVHLAASNARAAGLAARIALAATRVTA